MKSSACQIIIFSLAIIPIAIEGTFGLGLQRSILFAVLAVAAMVCLALAIFSGIRRGGMWSSVLSHAGLLLIIAGGLSGDALMTGGSSDSNAFREQTLTVTTEAEASAPGLPFGVRLEKFTTEYYEDGTSPRQYSADIIVDGQKMTTSVNHPCFHKGWLIYQYDCEEGDPELTVLKCVRDSWFPLVALGMTLLAVGSILSLRRVRSSKTAALVLVLALCASVVILFTMGAATPPPALRSVWFIPHLIIYMLAYSALAVSLCLAVLSIKGRDDGENSVKLTRTASSLMALGMLCGAVWAKLAWGNWWSWDPKECWAAVTWMLTLLPMHFQTAAKNRKILLLMISLAFVAMQLTWFGVDYLPSAQYSMHAYLK